MAATYGILADSPKSSTTYIAEIDGLRGIAVLAVIAFHYGLLPSGYLGVDLFFVISGFIITRLLWSELHAGTFSLAHFYARRVRRLAPALLVMLAITTVASLWFLLPADLMAFAGSLLAVLTFTANIYFWRDTDYFSSAAELKPLLHAWTLSVEEQFYLLFPLLLIFLFRFARANAALVIGAMAAASALLWALAYRIGADGPAFFLLPTRASELLLGSLIALTVRSPDLPRALRAAPLVQVGLMSYSLYLWHWPILALLRYRQIDPGAGAYAAALIVTFLVSFLSWRFIEQPFRHRANVVRPSGIAALGLAAAAALIVLANGLPGRHDERAEMLAYAGDNFRCPVARTVWFGGNRACQMGRGGVDLLLIGNSHAQMYAPAFQRGTLVAANGCLPVVGPNITENCRRIAERIIDAAARSDAEKVVIGFNWNAIHGYEGGLVKTIDRIGIDRVTVLGPIATPGRDLSSELSRARAFGVDAAPMPIISHAELMGQHLRLISSLPVPVLRPDLAQCVDGRCRFFAPDGRPMFADGSHLNENGAKLLLRFKTGTTQAPKPFVSNRGARPHRVTSR